MKIYIAGSSKDITRCEKWIAACREGGVEIAVDWTVAVRAAGANTKDDEVAAHYASEDLRGVREADIMWLLAPAATRVSSGCWTELGYALGRGIPVVYSAPPDEPPQYNIFTSLIERRFFTDEEAFEYITKPAPIRFFDKPEPT